MEALILIIMCVIGYYIISNELKSNRKLDITSHIKKIKSENQSTSSILDIKKEHQISDDWKIQTSIFSQQELKMYKQLREYVESKNAFVLSKVRIADLATTTHKLEYSTFKKIFNRIAQKHIDYVITDYAGHILCLIELDGNSHNTKKMQESDVFKNEFFRSLETPLIRFKNYETHDLHRLDEYIK